MSNKHENDNDEPLLSGLTTDEIELLRRDKARVTKTLRNMVRARERLLRTESEKKAFKQAVLYWARRIRPPVSK